MTKGVVSRFALCCLALAVGCRGERAGEIGRVSLSEGRPLLFEHGLRVGQMIAPLTLECSDGRVRTLGGGNAVQLVTFSTAGECSECNRHLSGLEQLYRTHQLPGVQFVVAYAPPARQTALLAAYQPYTSRPICFDATGALWKAYDISHTPVTALIRNSRVRYLDDAPLESPAELAAFRRAVLAGAGQQAR